MSLSSPIFLFFFLPLCYLAYRLCRKSKTKNILLCAASLVFYAFGQLKCVPLFLGSVVINYGAGLLLRRGKGRPVLIAAVALNVALLGVFKFAPELGAAGILLPLGISFFTFQGLSYVIDTYRNPERGTADFGKLFLYIAFFPRLIAGPIVKYHEIEDQLLVREETPDKTAEGIRRFIVGFAKKVLVAEPMAVLADGVMESFGSAGPNDFRLAWIFAISYALQIYYDFSGYSDMAIGIGKMFGFTFAENFDHPYGASSIREFWRKWHISLSSWFKEYVYIPLGGNRKGKTRAMINRLIVFLCTGIWHGANWTYVCWGVGHGLLASLEDMGVIPVKKLAASRAGRVLNRIYTLLAVTLLFVIFRAPDLGTGFGIIMAMFTSPAAAANNLLLIRLLTPAALAALGIALLLCGNLPGKWKLKETQASVLCLVLFVLSVLAMAKGNFTPFIYAQF